MKWLVVLLLIITNAWAGTTIRGEVRGQNVYWDNALTIASQQMVPSFWQHSSNLPTTNSWLPGGLAQQPATSITLQSAGNSVTIPVQFLGFEYNTGSATPTVGDAWSGDKCSSNNHNGTLIKVTGGFNCFLDYRLDYSFSVTPFTFIRPVFYINPVDVLAAFSGKAAGSYVGYSQLTSLYNYRHNTVESRQYLNHTFGVELDYQPAVINSVTVTGDNQLATHYDLKNQLVSASSRFNIVASGHFTDGLTVNLIAHRTDYLLYGPSLTEIPYSVDCVGCQTKSLVSGGNVMNLSSKVLGTNTSSITFDIDIYFQNQDLTSLEVGQYTDTITLILEPEI